MTGAKVRMRFTLLHRIFGTNGGNEIVVLHHPPIEVTDATRAGVAFFSWPCSSDISIAIAILPLSSSH